MPNQRILIGGVPIDHLDLEGAVARVDAFVRAGSPRQIVTVNLDFLAIARREPAFRQALVEADLALADGQPLVWLSHRTTSPLPERVAGVDLVDAACRLAAERGYRPFMLGAAPGVARAAAAELERRYPGLEIAGVHCPEFGPPTPAGDAAMVAAVRRARPDLLFVALGAPRQDLWIRQHLHELDVPVCMGVGGAFDLIAGELTRAPRWMRRAGLEWGFRLLQEPGRLWRRYLLRDIPLMAQLILNGQTTTVSATVELARPAPELAPPLRSPEPSQVGGLSD
jgi:N-acetylglucosaminyldiphosphoundecaprenol N-acetyl-beta-D-mannosaminyltransferase